MNLAEAVAIDPAGYETKACPKCGKQMAHRVRIETDGYDGLPVKVVGPWRHVETNEWPCARSNAHLPHYLETEFLSAIIDDRADDAMTIMKGMTDAERLKMDVVLSRAAKVVNLYREHERGEQLAASLGQLDDSSDEWWSKFGDH